MFLTLSIPNQNSQLFEEFELWFYTIIYSRSEYNEEMDFFFPGIAEDISYNSGISWSPTEESLVFMSNGGSGNYDLYLLPQLGNESTIRLTEDDEKDSHPQWSPVADHLIFVSGRTGKAEQAFAIASTMATPAPLSRAPL